MISMKTEFTVQLLFLVAFGAFGVVETQSKLKGFPKRSAIWNTLNIPVCWENGPPEKSWLVKRAIEETWSCHSGLNFFGWGQCSYSSKGIRIRSSDENPYVSHLGQGLNGVKSGMVLNFDFNKWSPSCRSAKDNCIQVIATHEFGHAIGLSHEQNRDDAPDWCKEKRQGSDGDLKITVYDPDSVMNYCCKDCWIRGRGNLLSEKDIQTVQKLYGGSACVIQDQCAKHGNFVCKKTDSYKGSKSTTISGKTCQRWDSQTPHAHTRNDTGKFPGENINHNYCRNPDAEPSPWCYTTDPDDRWGYCFTNCSCVVNNCARNTDSECQKFDSYSGTKSRTTSGKTCQRWDTQSPHRHSRNKTSRFPNGDIHHNYCRNPDGEGYGPWCYTADNDTRWEKCFADCAPECIDSSKNCMNADACDCSSDTGHKNTTAKGTKCQAWNKQSPHSHKYPERTDNYCRVYNKEDGGPWCYTMDDDVKWDYCYDIC